MRAKFVVVDDQKNLSWSLKKEEGEIFATFSAAEKRACELAEMSPGELIGIYELKGEVIAPVGKVESRRRKS